MKYFLGYSFFMILLLWEISCLQAQNETQVKEIKSAGQPAQLDIRKAGKSSIRITLKPISLEKDFPYIPSLEERKYPEPIISIRTISNKIRKRVGNLDVEVRQNPLTVTVTNIEGKIVQELVFGEDDQLRFILGDQPVLGMGEGGPDSPVNSTIPEPEDKWLNQQVEFDHRGRFLKMEPRPQGGAYGSRNPVPMLIGTEGWGLFIATPWVPWLQIDLTDENHGIVIPKRPTNQEKTPQGLEKHHLILGVYDLFVFDAHDPAQLMKDVSEITGQAVLPPKWALGYMQSHRTLEDDEQMIDIVKTFRSKQIPVDAVIYLGSGFVPNGWNKKQPSFEFNPEVFKRDPEKVISDLHDLNVKVAVHIWPWDEDILPTLHGSIPPKPDETLDETHILNYWKQHESLTHTGIDGYWPDSGDRFNLFARIKRHQMYYQGPLSVQPNIRSWSLHRNGYLGIAKWGGWMWSGDIISSWKTLEAQIAVGINHSLSLSPFWGSDIGGFFPNEGLTGELYARWFQFGAFTPSFRSHGKTWWTRLPWGWGLDEMGPRENNGNEPLVSELNNPAIEPICRKYTNLRYQLMPYTYTLAWQARNSGMPLMRAMWLHYPEDEYASKLGDQYLWGRDILVAPVFKEEATFREVYLPKGKWYDWWTNRKVKGGHTVTRRVNLSIMPIYVRAGAIIPFAPVRQYVDQKTDEPMTLRVYPGADGKFTLYEDDGKTLDYLDGEAEWTHFIWNDKTRKLTIEPTERTDVTMTQPRQFKVKLVSEQIEKTVKYTGKKIEIAMQ